ncbi:MAG: peptidylprolyl isomerase [Candidatus Methanomethylophilaceae archaeon]|jgi:peptidylprolyl isomerase
MGNVVLRTNMGEITIRLYDDMPITAGNFRRLVMDGFYDRTIFHRVIKDFMVQGGDPTGTGTGGPGYNIPDEFVKGHSNVRGTIAMANTGRPDSGGSQFFINLVDNLYLDWDNSAYPAAKHPVFGEVVEGMDVVDRIAMVAKDRRDRPLENVVILKAETC